MGLKRNSDFWENVGTKLKRWLRSINPKNFINSDTHNDLVDTYTPFSRVCDIKGSPYFINFDPSPTKLQMFFGRQRELATIISHLQKGESILLIGEKRIGKTFLLYILGVNLQNIVERINITTFKTS